MIGIIQPVHACLRFEALLLRLAGNLRCQKVHNSFYPYGLQYSCGGMVFEARGVAVDNVGAQRRRAMLHLRCSDWLGGVTVQVE
jgi:hypothetical protein